MMRSSSKSPYNVLNCEYLSGLRAFYKMFVLDFQVWFRKYLVVPSCINFL